METQAYALVQKADQGSRRRSVLASTCREAVWRVQRRYAFGFDKVSSGGLLDELSSESLLVREAYTLARKELEKSRNEAPPPSRAVTVVTSRYPKPPTTMPIAPITGKLRRRLITDLSVAFGLGISGAYAFW